MSDRRSAELFGEIFRLIRKHVPKDERKVIAERYWLKSADFDFHPSDMQCDAVLKKLGLAEEKISKTGEDVTIYRDYDD